ncbi:MAG: putative cytosolic protein [Candidatus Gottesmanbacteria bacterium GW2011_GWA1_47_8]|uniref:Putative cytosolic protein n=1 Tax=Candidatus Gottesmanbacteria bacterium GW2011_GWA1_47_8 TaxID=1618438 RepID=A0A0G1WFW1_9BACT|nr:MAG: putative cytosolic protein [Candidatus Gottesmanbacteria bacterium GW2011_GWA1_47_8]
MVKKVDLVPLLELEQYFWTPETIEEIATVVRSYKRIACLSAPTLGVVLPESVMLDVDGRLSKFPNFVYWDIKHTKSLKQKFDIIVSDPPYSLVTGQEFRRAVDVLAGSKTKLIVVDSEDGRLFVPEFPERNLKKMFEAKYYTDEEQPEPWYFWGDI